VVLQRFCGPETLPRLFSTYETDADKLSSSVTPLLRSTRLLRSQFLVVARLQHPKLIPTSTHRCLIVYLFSSCHYHFSGSMWERERGGNGGKWFLRDSHSSLHRALWSRSEESIFPSSSVDDRSRSEDLIRETRSESSVYERCEKELLY